MKISPVKRNAQHALAALAPSRLFIRSRFCAGTKLLNLKANFNFGVPLALFGSFKTKIAGARAVILGRVMRRRYF